MAANLEYRRIDQKNLSDYGVQKGCKIQNQYIKTHRSSIYQKSISPCFYAMI